MARPRKGAVCAICGKEPATTLDHIPPKGIFPAPRPNDSITVPACFRCNNRGSKLDEPFRVYLSLHIGTETPESERLWKKHALRTLRHNRKMRNQLLGSMRLAELRTPGGIILGKRPVGRWNSKAHDETIERMIRGLYFHHFGEVLGDKVLVRVQWLRAMNNRLLEVSEEWQSSSVGADAFIYRYGKAEDAPLHSVWLFQFYKRHWASGYTTPVEDSEDSTRHGRDARA